MFFVIMTISIHFYYFLWYNSSEPYIVFIGGARSDSRSPPDTVVSSRQTQQSGDPSPAKPSYPNPSAHPTSPLGVSDSIGSVGALKARQWPCLTIKRGKRLVVMQMDHRVIQFTSLSTSPYVSGEYGFPLFSSVQISNF